MSRLKQLRGHLTPGKVYRRNELAKWSTAVDRHLDELVHEGTLQKVSPGLYYYPKKTVFGNTPPDEKDLVAGFLKDDRFLVTSLNAYNKLGVGTTQLYNHKTVYNHKRHGEFKLGNRTFDFRIKHDFPKKVTEEFLMVDLVNNLGLLAEDPDEVLKNVSNKVQTMNKAEMKSAVSRFANVRTKKLYDQFLR